MALSKNKLIEDLSVIILSLVVAVALSVLSTTAKKAYEKHVIEKDEQSIVKITTTREGDSGGTGFVIGTKKGNFILTNAHLCRSLNGIGFIFLKNLEQPRLSEVIKISTKTDLCLMQSFPDLDPLSFGSKPDMHDLETAIGHPYLKPLISTTGNLVDEMAILVKEEDQRCFGINQSTSPHLFSSTECIFQYNAYLTNMIIYPGFSGSPVLNSSGHVVSVVFGCDPRTNYGFLVPYEEIVRFLEEEI